MIAIWVLFVLVSAVCGRRPDFVPGEYAECQLPASPGHQLDHCPQGTLYVSQRDIEAGYGTIQGAIDALSNDSTPATILIGPGSYHETLNITRQGPTTLLGVTKYPSSWKHNTVSIWNSSAQNYGKDNALAMVVTVAPNGRAALIGSGPLGEPLQPEFGCSDFRMYNIDVANRYEVNGTQVKMSDGPSGALSVSYANASFYHCLFESYQDTFYIGRNASSLIIGGQIRGSTDYIYGFGTAYFYGTSLASRGSGGGIVAWKGSEQWYGPDTYGAHFNHSEIIPSPDLNRSLDIDFKCALARPWNNQSRVVFMNTYMSDIVLPQGFIIWSKSTPQVIPNVTHFVESNSYGPGWNASARNLSLETILPKDEAALRYSLTDIFGSVPQWADSGCVDAL